MERYYSKKTKTTTRYQKAPTASFDYDTLNRLTSDKNGNIDYQTNGNIDKKEGIGNYAYNTTKPHAVSGITNVASSYSPEAHDLSFTAFNKIQEIEGENASDGQLYRQEFTYGPGRSRKQVETYKDGQLQKSKIYAGGNYEEVINHETGKTKSYHYIHGGSGLAAVFIAGEDSAKTDNLYYIHKDYLGSILCLSDEDGKAVERYSFDAWGHRRNPTNWSQWQEDSTNYIVNRGFTGHEHMDVFGLINMNGRIYDPDLGRFISPDPYVQMPDNSQNFNRYSYALNNPLKYTDPSGYNIQPHPRYDSWDKNITGAGRGFMRAFNQYGYMSSDQLGTPQLAYGYDWSTGTYRNNEGGVVSWSDVKDNMFNSNSSHDTYALFQTAFRNENDQWVGTGNFGVIKEGLYKSTGLYPTFTVYSNALDFASGMESGLGGSEGESNYLNRWLNNDQPLANGKYSAFYGFGGKIGFDAGGYKAFAGIHLYTVQRDLNYKGIENKHHYSGIEAGWGPFKAGFKYDWKANKFLTEGALGPIKWSTGDFPNAYMGGYLYLFGGIGGEIELNFGKIIDHYLHMNDWMGLPKGTPKW